MNLFMSAIVSTGRKLVRKSSSLRWFLSISSKGSTSFDVGILLFALAFNHYASKSIMVQLIGDYPLQSKVRQPNIGWEVFEAATLCLPFIQVLQCHVILTVVSILFNLENHPGQTIRPLLGDRNPTSKLVPAEFNAMRAQQTTYSRPIKT